MGESRIVYEEKYDALVKELLVMAIRAKRPTFLSYATPDKDGKPEYHNSIVSAAIEMPGYAKRINKLILAVQECDLKYPEHIQKCISDLTDWLESEGIYGVEDITLKTPKFRKFNDVAKGQMDATVPRRFLTEDDEEEEVVTKKKDDNKEE